MTSITQEKFVQAASLAELKKTNCLSVHVDGHNLVLFAYGDAVYAVDNRCPHMGFPLDKGTVNDGILTCHWHHARFDLASGGAFDQFADDVRAFPVEVRGDEIWVDVAPHHDPLEHQRDRLQVGLEQDISLVIGKAVLVLMEGGNASDPFKAGLEFGSRYRRNGWGQGLTIHACMMRILPHLHADDQPRALYHGLSATAGNTFGNAPRFGMRPLPDNRGDLELLKRWFRDFIEVRDDEGAERCIISAIRAGADDRQLAEMFFTAATDHRYIEGGHVLDFINKAFESLDIAGWQLSETVLTSLVRMLAFATRMEESNSWRNPIDLIVILEHAFDALPDAIRAGEGKSWNGRAELVPVLLGDDPHEIVDSLLDALRHGATADQIAGAVSYAAARRIAHFHTSNEFSDWDTALHSFTFANAVQMSLRRVDSPEMLRGVFDAAMSVYLDRFLNVPSVKLPQPTEKVSQPENLLHDLMRLLDQQQQVNPAGKLVVDYLFSGGDASQLMAQLGRGLLREDRDFHTIQMIEASFNQYEMLGDSPEGAHVLIAAARYLAAHAPTARAQGQTFQIAWRLHRGEKLFEGE
jgi:nitrite reductase/ring-hydroxylating ferredoxin subunit